MNIRTYMRTYRHTVCMYVFAIVYLLSDSNTGQYMLVGSDNGAVRVFPLTEGNSQEFKLDDFCSHWTFNIHDNHYGHVTHICCSHDDKYVITAGSDGNLFVFQASLEAKPKKKEVLHQGDIKVGSFARATHCCVGKIQIYPYVHIWIYSFAPLPSSYSV